MSLRFASISLKASSATIPSSIIPVIFNWQNNTYFISFSISIILCFHNLILY